jgi:uncharacterized protein DUF7009
MLRHGASLAIVDKVLVNAQTGKVKFHFRCPVTGAAVTGESDIRPKVVSASALDSRNLPRLQVDSIVDDWLWANGRVRIWLTLPVLIRRPLMKLRFKPNSVRLRLNRTEVNKFAKTGEITETIQFPGLAVLRYGLRVSGGPSPGAARFENCELMLTVPAADAKAWASRDEEIGLYYEQKLDGGGSLRIMIEKDFQCIDGPPEEKTRFPHSTQT